MTWRLLETVVVAVVEEAGIVVVETGAMVATATVMIPSIRDRTTMAHNHTEMTVVVQVTEEGTMEAMEEAVMAVVDMVEEVEVGIHINRIHTTRGLHTSPSHSLVPTEAMEGEEAMVAMVEIQLTHEAMPLVITPMTLVLVADTTPLLLSKIVIALTEMVVTVAVMADTVDMAQLHPSLRQVTRREAVRLIAAMSLAVGVEVGDRLEHRIPTAICVLP
jgi:hypothetical protein